MNKEKSLGYNLFVDRETSDLFTVFINLYIMKMEEGGFEGKKIPEGLHENFTRFLEENGEKVHKMGWCLDPNCEYKEDKE